MRESMPSRLVLAGGAPSSSAACRTPNTCAVTTVTAVHTSIVHTAHSSTATSAASGNWQWRWHWHWHWCRYRHWRRHGTWLIHRARDWNVTHTSLDHGNVLILWR